MTGHVLRAALRVGFFVASILAASASFAETRYALLVGVNQYRNLPQRNALVGPANDTRSLLEYLTGTPGLGFRRENITELANGQQPSDGEPSREGILRAMSSLAGRVAPGDFVFLHFGGHGSRQKARNPATEPDGLDEVFLPSDTGAPKDGIYPNALVDDEIGVAIDKIRSAGAFVFAVFDSCNSSSSTRATGSFSPDVAERWLPDASIPAAAPQALGADAMREPPLGPAEFTTAVGTQMGGLVAFFAAQTTEPTIEMRLPRGGEAAERHGLFTYTMLDVLAKKPGLTYRQLAQGIVYSYSVGNFNRPTPLFEGEVDQIVFAQEKRPPFLQWPVDTSASYARIPAGTLHGLAKDAILTLLPGPLAENDQALGYVRVRSSETLSSIADPVMHGGLAAPKLSLLPAGVYARPVELGLSFELAVELPDPAATRFAEAATLARQTIREIALDTSLPMNLRIVETGGDGDLRLIVGSETELYPDKKASDVPRLWFLPADGRLSSDRRAMAHSIGLDGGFSEDRLKLTKENLAAVFRATSLSRLSALSTLDSNQIEVGFSIRRKGSDRYEKIEAYELPVVSPEDEIYMHVENRSTAPIDVDVLVIGPSYSIQHLGNRFQAGEHLDTPLIAIGPSGFGLRRLLLVQREAKRNSDYNDLSFLEQLGVQTRGPAATGPRDFDQLLGDIGNAPATRSVMPYRSTTALKGSLQIFSIESVPRP